MVGRQGQIALAGSNIHVQSGSGWTSLGAGLVLSAALAPDGSLVAGGIGSSFPGGGRVARWTGTSWQSLDPTQSIDASVVAIAVRSDGEIFAGGGFQSPARGVVRLVGTTWQQVGAGLNGPVTKLRALPSGEVLAFGSFTASGTVALPGAAIWNGTSWAPVPGIVPSPVTNGVGLFDLDLHPSGDWLMAGGFASPSPVFARFRPVCPAAVVSTPGCSATVVGGTLVASSWPMLGSEFVARGTELPSNAVALAVSSSTAANIPLYTLLPIGVASCTLLVAPDILSLVPLQSGQGSWQWNVPVAPALIGASFRHQWLVVEFSGAAGIASLTATQMLELTVGSFL